MLYIVLMVSVFSYDPVPLRGGAAEPVLMRDWRTCMSEAQSPSGDGHPAPGRRCGDKKKTDRSPAECGIKSGASAQKDGARRSRLRAAEDRTGYSCKNLSEKEIFRC